MLTVKITEEQQKILLELLRRVNLTGAEVPAYISVVKVLSEAKKEVEEEVK